jgi:hypothetical protein
MIKAYKTETRWCEQPTDNVNFERCKCMAPFDNIFITPTPRDGWTKESADSFDAIINVSHSPEVLFDPSRPDQRTYWYPVNECGEWPYAYFALMFSILDHHYEQGHKIAVHCHAGAYRSPSIVRQWLRYKGYSMEEAYNIAKGRVVDFSEDSTGFKNYCMTQNTKMGNLPPNFDKYIDLLRTKSDYDHNYITSIYNKEGMISWRPEVLVRGHYFWGRIKDEIPVVKEYYRFKWWLRGVKEDVGRTLKGEEKIKLEEHCYRIQPATKGLALIIRKIRGKA